MHIRSLDGKILLMSVLIVLLASVISITIVKRELESEPTDTFLAEKIPFRREEVTAITLITDTSEICLVRSDTDEWAIENSPVPADGKKIGMLLDDLFENITVTEEKREPVPPAETDRPFTIMLEAGRNRQSVKKIYSTGLNSTGTYVSSEKKMYRLHESISFYTEKNQEYWMELSLFPDLIDPYAVTRLAVTFTPEDISFTIFRSGRERADKWEYAGSGPDSVEIDQSAVKNLLLRILTSQAQGLAEDASLAHEGEDSLSGFISLSTREGRDYSLLVTKSSQGSEWIAKRPGVDYMLKIGAETVSNIFVPYRYIIQKP